MNILETLILKFQDYIRPTHLGPGGQLSQTSLKMSVYVKTDKRLYFQDNLGVEHCLSHPDLSGLDADLLDGLDSTEFSLADHWHFSLNASDGDPEGAIVVESNGLVRVAYSLLTNKIRFGINNLVLGNGANEDVPIGDKGLVIVTGPTAAFSIGGFTGGEDGTVVVVINGAGQPMTLTNESAGSAPANRFGNLGAGSLTTSGAGSFVYIWSSFFNRWMLLSHEL